ncbi:MAG: response regulator [Methylococcaceae bacterium]
MKPIILNIGVGLIYFLLSRISLMLALTPGSVALIWPPAGLALAACLIWQGWRVWPGILIGSVVSNATAADGQFEQSWLPWAIACGSTLQALAGEKLLRHFEPALELARPKSVFRFGLIAFGSCIIAASNGSLALLLKGLINIDQVFLSFINWWLGDAFGVLIFTPLALVSFDCRESWNGRRWQVGVPLLIGMLFCGLLQHTMKARDEQELVTRFEGKAINMLNKVKQMEQIQTQTLINLTALFDASDQVTPSEFSTFSRRVVGNKNIFRAWEWVPLIRQTDAESYAKTTSQLLGRPIRITRLDGWSPNPNGWSAPVTFIEPREFNEPAQGLDILADPTRADAVEKAWRSDIPAITDKIRLAQDPDGPGAVLIVAPVHDAAGKTRGFCVGVLDFHQLGANLSEDAKDLIWRIEDISSGGKTMLANTTEHLPMFAKSPYVERKGIHYQEKIKLADREWRILIFQPFTTLGAERITPSLIIFFLALFMCSIFGAIALIISGDRRYIANEVGRKTRELSTEIEHRARIETDLRQSEEHIHTIFEQAPLGIALIDSFTGHIYEVNQKFANIVGRTREEMTHIDWMSITHPDDVQEDLDNMALLNAGKISEFNMNKRYIRPDGSFVWISMAIAPLKENDGKHKRHLCMIEDITDRRHNEMLIRENQQRLLDILNVSPIAVRIAINQGRKVIFYNQSYANLIKNPEPMGDTPHNYYARPEDYREILAELDGGNTVLNRQIKLRTPDDTEHSVLASYMPMQYQGKAAVLGWFYDITELIETREALARQLEIQRQAEATLRIASAEEHAIFDSATSGIMLLKDGIIQRCNRKLEEIFGYASGELEGKPTRLWYADKAAYETDGRLVYKAITYGKFHRLEQQLIRKDGSLFWARFSGKALDYEDPGQGLVGIIDDITLEHGATEALLKAKELAEEATRIKSEFLANMSHEIRTPMNGVLGMLDLLHETEMTTTQLDWLETAHSSAEALLEIINDILDLSKLEAGQFEVEQVSFSLADLVDDICALMAVRARAKGLKLNCLLPATLSLRWHGDPLRIRQVLTNLIGNALKFTEQGEVSVSVTRLPMTDSLDELRFEVRDTGIGISEATLPRLFKSFSQADSATSRRFGGSGLGLFISKKLVELMGGTIGADSVPNQGSCFWFTLPLMPDESLTISLQSYDLTDKHALIVDDNATNRNILSHYLSSWGVKVSEVDNSHAALLQLQTLTRQGMIYDLILLDIQMPVMDGLTLAKCLAQIPGLAKIPIVLLSSDIQIEAADYQGTGIVQRLLKPVRQMQLFDAMVNALRGGSDTALKPAQPDIELPSYKDKKVLVVEDNKINQKVIIAKLARFHIVPDLAENGQLALDKLAQNSYDLIFMDCHMPVMDGYTATRELRLLETGRGLPHQAVVALTANALKGEREKCLAAGMDDYLTKPIVSEQLMALLAERLGSQPATVAPTIANENLASIVSNPDVWDATATLAHLEGDSALLEEMIALFLTETPKQLGELTRSMAEGNLAALANTAHAIKGTVAHFHAANALAYARQLEQTARNGQSADYKSMTEALVNAVSDLMNAMLMRKI